MIKGNIKFFLFFLVVLKAEKEEGLIDVMSTTSKTTNKAENANGKDEENVEKKYVLITSLYPLSLFMFLRKKMSNFSLFYIFFMT